MCEEAVYSFYVSFHHVALCFVLNLFYCKGFYEKLFKQNAFNYYYESLMCAYFYATSVIKEKKHIYVGEKSAQISFLCMQGSLWSFDCDANDFLCCFPPSGLDKICKKTLLHSANDGSNSTTG